MKIYLAASYKRREEIATIRDKLLRENPGIDITSRWLDGEDPGRNSYNAQVDIHDIDRADILIKFTDTPEAGYLTGGKQWEHGYAFGRGKDTFIVGPRESVFDYHPYVMHCDTIEEVTSWLALRYAPTVAKELTKPTKKKSGILTG